MLAVALTERSFPGSDFQSWPRPDLKNPWFMGASVEIPGPGFYHGLPVNGTFLWHPIRGATKTDLAHPLSCHAIQTKPTLSQLQAQAQLQVLGFRHHHGEDQGCHNAGIGFHQEAGGFGRQFAPRDFFVRHGPGVAAVAGGRIANLTEIGP